MEIVMDVYEMRMDDQPVNIQFQKGPAAFTNFNTFQHTQPLKATIGSTTANPQEPEAYIHTSSRLQSHSALLPTCLFLRSSESS